MESKNDGFPLWKVLSKIQASFERTVSVFSSFFLALSSPAHLLRASRKRALRTTTTRRLRSVSAAPIAKGYYQYYQYHYYILHHLDVHHQSVAGPNLFITALNYVAQIKAKIMAKTPGGPCAMSSSLGSYFIIICSENIVLQLQLLL